MLALRAIQITDARVLEEDRLLARVRALVSLPISARRGYAVQLRDPELSGKDLLRLGTRLREATRAVGAALLVNDRIDLALALGAEGVHLGRRSVGVADARSLLPPGTWISLACHGVADVVRAAREGADAAVLSPIFASPGKGAPLGTAALREARAAAHAGTRLVALGGVDAANAAACFDAGADAVAAIRADLAGVLA